MPPLPIRKTNPRGPYQRPLGQGSQLRVRQIQENLLEEQEEQDDQNEIQSVDPESALYIKELSGDWADVNHIAPSSFKEVKNFNIILTQPKKYGWKQQQQRNLKIQWLADTGSPRSFITRDQANKIMKQNPARKLQPYKSQTKYRCFNKNNLKIEGELNLTLQSRSCTAQNCRIPVVGLKINNLMGRDILQNQEFQYKKPIPR